MSARVARAARQLRAAHQALRLLQLQYRYNPTTTHAIANANLNAPKKLKKIDGYRSLAQYMNRVAHTQWTDKTARSRFESLIAAFRKAKREDSHKLQSVYQRLDALYCSPEGTPLPVRRGFGLRVSARGPRAAGPHTAT